MTRRRLTQNKPASKSQAPVISSLCSNNDLSEKVANMGEYGFLFVGECECVFDVVALVTIWLGLVAAELEA